MTVEFRVTSRFSDLSSLARERDTSPEWQALFSIKPSINRIARLRGRFPTAGDLPDIDYDLRRFAGRQVSRGELLEAVSLLAEVETSYYPLAANLGASAAISSGKHERIPDFIDTAKDLVARQVWVNWHPGGRENYFSLHKRIVGTLKNHILHIWIRKNSSVPFSSIEDYQISKGRPLSDIHSDSPRPRPLSRLRDSSRHLSLPSIIAVTDKSPPMEKVATLTLMGYYPNGKGLQGLAKSLGVKRDSLSSAIDRNNKRLLGTKGEVILPERSIINIVEELIKQGVVMKYPSGKNVERTNPRLRLLDIPIEDLCVSEIDKNILKLAVLHRENTFLYSTDKIGEKVGMSKVYVCRTIKRIVEN